MSRVDFHDLASRAVAEAGQNSLKRAVEKELLHFDILHIMARQGFLDNLVFHGGTALRLCHAGERLSEDLDFCTRSVPAGKYAAALGPALKSFLEKRYGLQVRITEPRDQSYASVRVERWWVSVQTEPGRPDLPWQRIKIAIAAVPARSHEARTLGQIYSVLPGGYADTVLRAATRECIVADKLVAFPAALPSYVRWRDIWDICWLHSRGTGVDLPLFMAKLDDYGVRDFGRLLAEAAKAVTGLVRSGEFARSLENFVPASLAERTLHSRPWLEATAVRFCDILTGLQREFGNHGRRIRPPD